jgi:hypothetical protein
MRSTGRLLAFVLPLVVVCVAGSAQPAQAGYVSKCGYYWDYCFGCHYSYCGGKYQQCCEYYQHSCYTCKWVWESGRGVGPFQRWKQERQMRRKSQQ